MTAATLDWLVDAKERERAEAEARFMDVARLVADGRQPDDPAEARRIILAAGKTDQDLREAAKLLRDRRVWAAEMADGLVAAAEEAETLAAIAKLDREFAVVQREYLGRRGPLLSRIDDAGDRQSHARVHARGELLRSARTRHPALVAEHARIQQAKWDAEAEALDWRRQAEEWDLKVMEFKAVEFRDAAPPRKSRKAEAEAAKCRERAEQCTRKAQAIQAEVDQAEARLLEP